MFRSDNKRAVSTMVAYVILISITISLSVLVYNWLRFYVNEQDVKACPEEVNIVIRTYDCVATNGEDPGWLNVTLKNKGLFTVDGYTLRAHDRENADFGLYTLNDAEFPEEGLAPGEEVSMKFGFQREYSGHTFQNITFLEVQPYIREGGKISCKSHSTQKIEC